MKNEQFNHIRVKVQLTETIVLLNYRKHIAVLILTFGPTLQFEWVTMKHGCFSTAGTLSESGSFIVRAAW